MQRDEDLPIIRASYEFSVWLIPKIGKFPRDLRFTLGEKIPAGLVAICERPAGPFAQPARNLLIGGEEFA